MSKNNKRYLSLHELERLSENNFSEISDCEFGDLDAHPFYTNISYNNEYSSDCETQTKQQKDDNFTSQPRIQDEQLNLQINESESEIEDLNNMRYGKFSYREFTGKCYME
ncbi:unnamed protein product [Diabrotica balteata]|uniref:GON domain-containing protein n=1 Tax=Diabrotica balteata TaxID=107213 RepID=A0A9N9X765_DIABA|nr:unnamed protein product [Diabrotica balteata]